MTYQEAVNYLNSFINYEKKIDYPYSKKVFDLGRINLLLEKLGNPHKGIKFIHIAGSKGKGSVACLCASILKESGLKVGLYTSPHLETFRERIRVNDELISKDDVTELIQLMKPSIEEINSLTFFEVYTALAFLYFKKQGIDLAVIEVGLGGRLDATNVIEPEVVCISPLSFEHTQKLGNTLESIAREKSAIIKKNTTVVCAPQAEEALKVIKEKAAEEQVPLYIVGKDILYQALACNDENQTFKLKAINQEYDSLEINLLGEHQIINAACAVAAVEALSKRINNININEGLIKKGLSSSHWPGRLEVVARNPLIVLDGAQNVASAQALIKALKRHFSYKNLVLVLGISKDKSIAGIVKVLEGEAQKVIITRANLARAAEPEVIASFFKQREEIKITHSVNEAVSLARKEAEKDDLIIICGSLFVIAEARKTLGLAKGD